MFSEEKQNIVISLLPHFFSQKENQGGYSELLLKKTNKKSPSNSNAFEILNLRMFIARIHYAFPRIFICLFTTVFNANDIQIYVFCLFFL